MSMKAKMRPVFLLSIWLACVASAFAAEPAPPQPATASEQPDFSPPPVPEFMLRKPAVPLTLEEMQTQADEASRRARNERERRAASPNAPAKADDERAK